MMYLSQNSKGQSAIEFLIIVMAVLFLFVGLFYFVQGKISDLRKEGLSAAVREVALTVQEDVNLASEATDGYSRVFVIPQNINGLEYTANITDGYIYVRTIDGKNAIALPLDPVTGNIMLGVNSIYKSNNTIFLNS